MHIDIRKRKEEQTRAAINFVQSIAPTPVLLEIHYPSLLDHSPPSYYIITKGFAHALSRAKATEQKYILHVIYLQNGETRLIWK